MVTENEKNLCFQVDVLRNNNSVFCYKLKIAQQLYGVGLRHITILK